MGSGSWSFAEEVLDDIHLFLYNLIRDGTWNDYTPGEIARELMAQKNDKSLPKFIGVDGKQPSYRTFYRIVNEFIDVGAEAFKSKLRPVLMHKIIKATEKQADKNPTMLKALADIAMPTPQKVDINVQSNVYSPELETIFARHRMGGVVSAGQGQAALEAGEGEIIEGDCPPEERHVGACLDDPDAAGTPAAAEVPLGCGTDLFEGDSEGEALPAPPGDAQDDGDNGGGDNLRPADGPE